MDNMKTSLENMECQGKQQLMWKVVELTKSQEIVGGKISSGKRLLLSVRFGTVYQHQILMVHFFAQSVTFLYCYHCCISLLCYYIIIICMMCCRNSREAAAKKFF